MPPLWEGLLPTGTSFGPAQLCFRVARNTSEGGRFGAMAAIGSYGGLRDAGSGAAWAKFPTTPFERPQRRSRHGGEACGPGRPTLANCGQFHDGRLSGSNRWLLDGRAAIARNGPLGEPEATSRPGSSQLGSLACCRQPRGSRRMAGTEIKAPFR